MSWWGLALRYFHPVEPVREQATWTPEGIFMRETFWWHAEVGLVLRLAAIGATGR